MSCSASGDGEREGESDEEKSSLLLLAWSVGPMSSTVDGLSTGPAIGGGGLSGRAVAPGGGLPTCMVVW